MSELIEQGTAAWHELRLGRVTASRISDVMAKGKNGEAVARAKYMGELIAERLTREPTQHVNTPAMQWGTDTEPMARAAYEFLRDVDVEQVGFVVHPDIIDSGASPDGFVGEDGLIEIKCPNTHTHIDTLITGKIDPKYVKQMQWQMECTGREWCDFISFDPRLPAKHQLHVRRVERDRDAGSEMRREVMRFLSDMQAKIDSLDAERDAA